MYKENSLSLEQMLERKGILTTDFFGDVVKRLRIFDEFKLSFERDTIETLEFGATSFEELKLKEIKQIEDWVNDTDPMYYYHPKEADFLRRIGFEYMKESPQTSLYHLLEKISTDKLMKLISLKWPTQWLYEVAGPKNYNELSNNEIFYEGLFLIIEGGSRAVYLQYLKQISYEQIGEVSNDNSRNQMYYLLKEYYEKDRPLKSQDFDVIAKMSGFSEKGLRTMYYKINREGFLPSVDCQNTNKILGYWMAYNLLAKEFEGINPDAFNRVQLQIKKLSNKHSDFLKEKNVL